MGTFLFYQAAEGLQASGPTQHEFWVLGLDGLLMILAVLIAPFVAIRVQWYLERRRQKLDRKMSIFKTLMATRAENLAFAHVQALNAIDVEFDGNTTKESQIRGAWKTYLDHLNIHMDWESAREGDKSAWIERKNDLLADLLQKMAALLGYDFAVDYLKRHVYAPRGHDEWRQDEFISRKSLIAVLTGRSAIKMKVDSLPATITEEEAQEQTRLRRALLQLYEHRDPFPIKIVKDPE